MCENGTHTWFMHSGTCECAWKHSVREKVANNHNKGPRHVEMKCARDFLQMNFGITWNYCCDVFCEWNVPTQIWLFQNIPLKIVCIAASLIKTQFPGTKFPFYVAKYIFLCKFPFQQFHFQYISKKIQPIYKSIHSKITQSTILTIEIAGWIPCWRSDHIFKYQNQKHLFQFSPN